tara:strand:- start:1549 stop:2571 length:1023 start_codon:yes stop_codon:yes gene_type:complete
MENHKMKKLALSLAVSSLAMSASAMDPLPPEAGFSGFLAAGAAGGQVKSNFLAEVLSIDLSNDDIYQYDSPDQTDIIIPSFGYNLGYTFAGGKTRIYLGTAVEDSLDFSTNTVLAVRHDFDSIGNIELAGLAPGVAKLEVWENPYQLGSKRSSTERTTSGGRITWDKMFGTGLEFIGNFRTVDLDHERSGEGLGLTQNEQKLLDREGDVTRIELGYAMNFSEENLVVRPSAAYIDRDLDGNAMAQDGYELGISLTYDAGKYVWLNRAVYQSLNGDETNPIFNEKNDADIYVLASEIRVPDPFGWENWFTTVGVQWADNQADIDFNKSSIAMFSARVGRRF